jgi:hypothetical protein
MARLLPLLALVLALTPSLAQARGLQPSYLDVPEGKTLVVVGQSGVARADAFARGTGTEPVGAMWYLPLYEEPAAMQAMLDDISAAVATHRGLVVNLGLSFGAISTPSPPYTAAIAAGAYDDRLDLLADWMRGLEAPVHLRIGYEFDLLGGQYGPPAVYKAGYRHVVDHLRGAGVENARFVWHSSGAFWRGTDASLFAVSSGTVATAVRSAAPGTDPQPIEAFYPGRDYVDAFGISYWQDSCCFGESGDAARAVYEERTREILRDAEDLGLPIHISESTPVYIGADSGRDTDEWLQKTFDLVEDFDIRSLSLISIDWQEGGFFAAPFWNGYWPDARIHAFPRACKTYRSLVASKRYVFRRKPARTGCA